MSQWASRLPHGKSFSPREIAMAREALREAPHGLRNATAEPLMERAPTMDPQAEPRWRSPRARPAGW